MAIILINQNIIIKHVNIYTIKEIMEKHNYLYVSGVAFCGITFPSTLKKVNHLLRLYKNVDTVLFGFFL